MPRKLQIVFILVFSILTIPLSAIAAQSKTVVLEVPGMTCKFCPITIRKALQKVPGVTEAKADFASKTATVTFDPDKTTIKALTEATANAGYPSTVKQK